MLGKERPVRISMEVRLKRITRVAALALGLVFPGAAPAAVPFEEIAPPIGPPTDGKMLTSNNDETSVLSRDQGLRIGAVPLPDVHPTYIRFDDGSIRFWIQGGGGTSIFTTTDFRSFTPSPISSRVMNVLTPSKPLSDLFDADYAGGSSIFPSANRRALLMI